MTRKRKQKLFPGNLVEPRYKDEGNKVLNYYPFVYGEYFTMTDDAIGMHIKKIFVGTARSLDVILFGDRLVQVPDEEDSSSDFGNFVSLVKKYEAKS